MNTVTRVIAAAAVAFTALFGLATTAHADDQSYLDKINHSGVAIFEPPNVLVASGRYLCAQLRAGQAPDALVREYTNFMYSAQVIRVEVDAAQTELCPDTLPGAPAGGAPSRQSPG